MGFVVADKSVPDPPLVLAVRMRAEEYRRLQAGGCYCSSDGQRSRVSRFLRVHGLPDPEPFTSIAVFLNSIPDRSPFYAYGTVTGYLHVVRVLPRIMLVAADDVQDAAANQHPERFRTVEGDEAIRLATLSWAAECPFGRHYAEARVKGALFRADFVNFDTSGDFELNLEQILK